MQQCVRPRPSQLSLLLHARILQRASTLLGKPSKDVRTWEIFFHAEVDGKIFVAGLGLRVLEGFHLGLGHLGLPQVERLEVFQTAQLVEAGIGHRSVEVQVFRLRGVDVQRPVSWIFKMQFLRYQALQRRLGRRRCRDAGGDLTALAVHPSWRRRRRLSLPNNF